MTTWINKVDARAEGAEQSITEQFRIRDLLDERNGWRIELTEVPLEGSVSIPGFTEVETAPGLGQFRVHYARDLHAGVIHFNLADGAKLVTVSYQGRGSPIRAADINQLQNLKPDHAFAAIADAGGAVRLQASGAGTLRLKSGDGIALRFDRESNTLLIESVPVGWLPTSIAGCVAWLDAEHVDTEAGVQRWEDRSGAGNHFVLHAGAGGALLAGALNDHDAVRLNGLHSYRNHTLSLGSAFSVFAVVARETPWSGTPTGWQRLLTSDQRFSLGAHATELGTQSGDGGAWTGGGSFGADAALEHGGFRVVSLVHGGSGDTGFVQGQSVGALAPGGATLPAGVVLGSSDSAYGEGWDGSLATLLIYNRALGTTERRAVEQYLARKYALPIEHTIFSEMGPPAGWFDAGTLALQDGEAVETWTNRNAAGGSLSQPDAARRPTLRTGVANGRPVVRFGGNGLLSLASELSARHVFVVLGNCVAPGGGVVTELVGGPRPVFADLAGGEAFSVFQAEDGAGNTTQTFTYATRPGSATEVSLAGRALAPAAGFGVVHASASGSRVGLAVNGVSDAQAAYPSAFRFGRVGGRPGSGGPGMPGGEGSFDVVDGDPGAYLLADVAELLVFDRDLSTAERKQVEQYLATKFAVRVYHDAVAEVPGAMLWLASDGLPNGRVSSWTDRSQRGNHLVQPDPARQPWGGSTGVIFEEGPGMYLSRQLEQMQAPLVFFVVCEFGHLNQPTANHDCVLGLADSGETMAGSQATLSRHANDGANRNRYFSFDGVAKRFGPELTPGTGEREIFTVIHGVGAPRHRLRVNGVELTVQDYPEAHYNAGELFLGCSPARTDWFNGTVHSVLLYDRALSPAEIQTVEQHLLQQYLY